MACRSLVLALALPLVVAVVPSGARAAPVDDGPSEDDFVRPQDVGPVALSSAQRRERAAIIRDAAAAVGMTNAALLAGIGQVESGFAHCWSEATWACQGPPSASCGGGPVMAGAADGPCADQQGGLGMFQFDAGTYADTIARYGEGIVTIEGNVGAVVPFLTTRAVQSVDGIADEAAALAWMNSIRIVDGDPEYERWLYFVAWRYNGCKGCAAKIERYREGTNQVWAELGADFWGMSTPPPTCEAIPAEGRAIDETDACFGKGGDARWWHAGETGQGGACLWTNTTDADEAENYGVWTLRFAAAGRYRLEVYTDGGQNGQSRTARYQVTHAGGTTDVIIDQSARDGFQSLGEFDFATGDGYGVRLGDNTGERYVEGAKVRLLFDTLRVVPAGTPFDDGEGGCTAAPGGAPRPLAAGLVALALLALARRRRARCP
jgi:MYXO-CTERM domain-containing protein